jgi:LPXTG-site transpeptidase (sortase) family protein
MIVSIHWDWVLAAFLAGSTLILFVETWRRQRKSWLLLSVLVSLLWLAGGVWLVYPADNRAQPLSANQDLLQVADEIPSISSSVQTEAEPFLPQPQISLREVTPPPTLTATPIFMEETAVRRLHIPALQLNKPVLTIPLENGSWDVSTLGGDVGWLAATAAEPGGNQPMVFVGHMTFADDRLLEEGAFAHIPTLPYGSAVVLETNVEKLTYRIDSVRRAPASDVSALFQETGDAILLLTCADWNPLRGVYDNRLLVRAVRDK